MLEELEVILTQEEEVAVLKGKRSRKYKKDKRQKGLHAGPVNQLL